MSQEIKLYVRTADQTRRAELDLDPGSTGADIIQAAVDNWALPADTDYTLVNTTTGRALAPGQQAAEPHRALRRHHRRRPEHGRHRGAQGRQQLGGRGAGRRQVGHRQAGQRFGHGQIRSPPTLRPSRLICSRAISECGLTSSVRWNASSASASLSSCR